MPAEDLPLVSIVTPSYNMAAFIAQAVASVLSQDYPRIEYIVVDGASTDDTHEVLRPYRDRLTLISEPDTGPAEAINRGLAISSGSIFAWLNADDTYLPGAVRAAVGALTARPAAGAVYGDAYWTDADGHEIAPYPTRDFDPALLASDCFICQPACFLRREVIERVSMLNPALQYSFDYDLWIRLSTVANFHHLPQPLATSRMHFANRTLGQRRRIFQESFCVLRQHYGYIPFRWIHSYCSYILDRRDQFYQPLRPTFFKYLLSLPVGLRENRGQRSQYCREWASVMKRESLVRMTKSRWSAALHRIGLRRGNRVDARV